MDRLELLPKAVVLAAGVLSLAHPGFGQTATNGFSFNDFLLVPLRVHLLSAKDSPALQTTLTEKDITRILTKINGVWAQAGLHFYLESLVGDEANQPELYTQHGSQADRYALLGLRPQGSMATNVLHIYYLKEMSMNGIYFPEAIFVKDTASLRKVEGGIDEPLPRVTSHELGHALSLPHRQDTTNLMASGTTGIGLNNEEIKRARETVRRFDGIESAPEVMKKADALFQANKSNEAAALYSRMAMIPAKSGQVSLAKNRATNAARSNLNQITK
ncbi:MAG: hypothetical protein HY298_01290 [Verrucomicrobia bacterium]|nr:hypothetical protein [Verrucomicrobiota bacterium]